MTDNSVSCKLLWHWHSWFSPRRALDPPAPLQRPLGCRVPPWQWLQSADGQGSLPGGMVYIMLTRCKGVSRFKSSFQTGVQISRRSSLSRKKANQLWGRVPDFLTWFSVKIFPSVPISRPLWQTCKSCARSSRTDHLKAFASKDFPSCSQSRYDLIEIHKICTSNCHKKDCTRYTMHNLLNEIRELAEQKAVSHRDFYNVRKVKQLTFWWKLIEVGNFFAGNHTEYLF